MKLSEKVEQLERQVFDLEDQLVEMRERWLKMIDMKDQIHGLYVEKENELWDQKELLRRLV